MLKVFWYFLGIFIKKKFKKMFERFRLKSELRNKTHIKKEVSAITIFAPYRVPHLRVPL